MQSQNLQQSFSIFHRCLGDFVSVSIGTLCVVFVPQQLFIIDNLSIIVLFILSVNILTMFLFMYLFFVELKREFWLVNHFDYSKRYDSLHLQTYKTRYPELFTHLKKINYDYYNLYYALRILYILNILCSASYIVGFNFLDYKTITSLLTSSWFCLSKIRNGIDVSKQSIEYEIGYSYYNIQNLSFNRIDPAFKKHYSTSNVNSLNDSQGRKSELFSEETI
jgi:hypothetical protein